MYKILVVDDETIIREGIGGALNKIEELTVSFASNGLEAIELCKNEKFDGMLIDIAMPKMDGIELLEELYKNGDESIKMILSAHDNFEYARHSIKFAVSDYLVKPLYPEDINKIALKFIDLIESKKEKQKQHEQLLQEVDKDKDIIKNRLIQDLINGNIEKNDLDIQRDFLSEILEYKTFRVLLVCVKFDKQYFAMSSKEYQARLLSIAKDIKNKISEDDGTYYVTRNSNVFCILLSDTCRDCDIEELFNELKVNIDASLFGGLGDTTNDIILVKQSYREALISLKYNLSICRESLLNISDISIKSINTKRVYDEDQFCTSLKLNDKNQILQLFDSISKFNSEDPDPLEIYDIELFLQRIATASMGELLQSDFESYRKKYQQYCGVIYNILNKTAITEKILMVKNFILEILETLKNNAENNNSKIIDRAKSFINQNYNKDLSINDIAIHVNLSKNYLGYLFKQSTGINIIEYIHRVRVTHAKRLIEEHNTKIYEISNRVGYTDQHYFSLIFKKIVGVSPSEYKELI